MDGGVGKGVPLLLERVCHVDEGSCMYIYDLLEMLMLDQQKTSHCLLLPTLTLHSFLCVHLSFTSTISTKSIMRFTTVITAAALSAAVFAAPGMSSSLLVARVWSSY
jgi:uncharacterized membrane protein